MLGSIDEHSSESIHDVAETASSNPLLSPARLRSIQRAGGSGRARDAGRSGSSAFGSAVSNPLQRGRSIGNAGEDERGVFGTASIAGREVTLAPQYPAAPAATDDGEPFTNPMAAAGARGRSAAGEHIPMPPRSSSAESSASAESQGRGIASTIVGGGGAFGRAGGRSSRGRGRGRGRGRLTRR